MTNNLKQCFAQKYLPKDRNKALKSAIEAKCMPLEYMGMHWMWW